MTTKLRKSGTGTVTRRRESELMTVAEWKAKQAAKSAEQLRGNAAPVKYGSAITPEKPRQKTQQQKDE